MADPGQPIDRKRRYRKIGIGLCGCAIAVAVLVWLRGPESDELRTEGQTSSAPQEYVTDASCADCHAQIAVAYKTHPMSQSLNTVAAAAVVEDYEKRAEFSPLSNLHYRIEKRDGGTFHHEIRTDVDGKVIYDQAVPVHFALGSGKRGRSFLIDRGGILFASPIAWYSTKSRWDLSPGYVPGRNLRFERRVHDLCIRCHSGRVNPRPHVPDTFQKPAFHAMSIGCQNCHGPGRKHVEFRKNGGENSESDPIVNPARLDPARRESVCNHCHLTGEEIVLRQGKSAFDFRPGKHLNDVMSVFVKKNAGGHSGGTMPAVSQVMQMRSSRCFQESAGKMGCTSCHNPHSTPAAEKKAEYFRERCLKCHSTPQATCAAPESVRQRPPARNSCVYCHMPAYGAGDIPHTAQTDHRILRQPISGKTKAKPVAPSIPSSASNLSLADLEVFDHSARPIPNSEASRARGIVLARIAVRSGSINTARVAESLLHAAKRSFPKDVETLKALADVLELQGRAHEAADVWRKALQIQPRNETVLSKLADFLVQSRQFETAAATLKTLLGVNPWHAEDHFQYAQVLANLGRKEDAIQTALRAAALDRSLPAVHQLLATLYNSSQNPEAARRHADMAKRLGGR